MTCFLVFIEMSTPNRTLPDNMVSAGKRLTRTSKKANERLVLNAQSSMPDLRSVQSPRNPIEIQGKTLDYIDYIDAK